MKIPRSAFNLFLLSACLSLAACKTTEEKEAAKQATNVEFHLETNPDGTAHSHPIPVYRENPIMLNVETDAVLDTGFMDKAEVVPVDAMGGYAIKITFNEDGKKRLENVTTANKGMHLAILAQWKEVRWLAAPLINRQISDGVFVFTPDASREESERIVQGLNNVIKKIKKPYTF